MFKLIEKLYQFEHVHTLIRLKGTGTPEEFAKKLEVSKRSLERIIQEMRDIGLPIVYDTERHTYYYEREVKFFCELEIDKKKEILIKGGKKMISPPNYGGNRTYFYNKASGGSFF